MERYGKELVSSKHTLDVFYGSYSNSQLLYKYCNSNDTEGTGEGKLSVFLQGRHCGIVLAKHVQEWKSRELYERELRTRGGQKLQSVQANGSKDARCFKERFEHQHRYVKWGIESTRF